MSRLICLAALLSCVLPFILAQQSDLPLPVVLPPFGVKGADGVKPGGKPEWGTCLLYLEGVGITVFNRKSDASPRAWNAVIDSGNGSAHTFAWADDYVNCIKNETRPSTDKFTPLDFSFKVSVKTSKPVEAKQRDRTLFSVDGTFVFTLNFQTIPGYGWQLTDVTTDGFKVTKSGDWLSGDITVDATSATNNTVRLMNVGAYGSYNYACSGTKLAVFDTKDEGFDVGVYFKNIQVQPFGLVRDNDKVHFSHNTADCIGTFTHGSLMGIIVALVLASVLVFGFLMLNSVQTVDRFDDPKQKQLMINSKD